MSATRGRVGGASRPKPGRLWLPTLCIGGIALVVAITQAVLAGTIRSKVMFGRQACCVSTTSCPLLSSTENTVVVIPDARSPAFDVSPFARTYLVNLRVYYGFSKLKSRPSG